MAIPQEIDIKGEQFRYIKSRRMGGAVYTNEAKDKFLRTANKEEIRGEVNLTRDLKERGFPVPTVLDHGEFGGGLFYYIESSIGTRTFGELFKKETDEHGGVTDKTFNAFTEVALRYASAQFNERNFVPQNRADISRTILLYNVLRNHPPSEDARPEFDEAIKRVADRVTELPFGYLQSDLNAYNILENGVIDFENASHGPVGFDVMTNVSFGRLWPRIARAYVVSDEQIGRYNDRVDELAIANKLPKMTEYRNEFLLLKAVRATNKMGTEQHRKCNPQFWTWRVRVRDWCIQKYLKGEQIHTREFERVGGEVTKHPEHIYS